jgi:biopolymer transport protein ExbB/TolQ
MLSISNQAFAEDPATAPKADDSTTAPVATPETAPTETAPAPVAPDTAPATDPTTAPKDGAEGAPETTDGTNTVDPATAPSEEAPAAPEATPAETAPAAPAPVAPAAEADAHAGGHAGQFTVEEMWNQSSGPVRAVLGTLLFMLVAAMGVGLERLITLQGARSQSRKLAGEVGPLLNDGKLKEALGATQNAAYEKSYLGHMLSAGLTEFSAREDHYGIEAVERAIDKNAIVEIAALNKGLNILATVGSTAPFVGLVGTIFGIINAFGQIGAEGGADLTTLAPAIGEALITTAFGIIVAIVGVWLFNYFTAMIGSITNDMAESSAELTDWCHKRIIPDGSNAK